MMEYTGKSVRAKRLVLGIDMDPGLVGKRATQQLSTGTEKIGEIYAESMMEPLSDFLTGASSNAGLITEGGVPVIKMADVFHDSKNDSIILSGAYATKSASEARDMAKEIISIANEMGVEELYSFSGTMMHALNVPDIESIKVSENPKVYTIAGTKDDVFHAIDSGAEVLGLGNPAIAEGISAFLVSEGRKSGKRTIMLSGETMGRPMNDDNELVSDPMASQSVLKVFEKASGVKVDYSGLREEFKAYENAFKSTMRQMGQQKQGGLETLFGQQQKEEKSKEKLDNNGMYG